MARIALLIALAALLGAAPAGAEPTRRLVTVQNGRAVLDPVQDSTAWLPIPYAVKGADLWKLEGLPVRLLGEWEEGRVLVPPPRPGQEPPALPADPEAWHARLQAEVLSLSPARARLELGRGDTMEVEVVPEDPAAWQALSPGALVTLEATMVGRRALDARVASPLLRSARRGPVRFWAQLSEDFLDRSMARYRQAHPEQFAWRDEGGLSAFEVGSLGLTLGGCAPGQVRLFGSLKGRVAPFPQAEGQWEVVAAPRFRGAELEFPLVPGSLRVRLVKPLAVPVPAAWTGGMQGLLEGLSTRIRVPVPGAYWKDLTASGVVRDEDLPRLEVLTLPTGDRRTSLLVVAGPVDRSASDRGPDLLQDRIVHPASFALALSGEAMTEVLKRNVPPLLPMRRPLPPEARVEQQVLIFKLVVDEVEISKLALDYRPDGERGVVGIQDLVANVHWRLGFLSGWEPGVRLQGTARVESRRGPPLAMLIYPAVSHLEFLSGQILSRPAGEQEALRRRVIEGLQGLPLDVLLPAQMPIQDLGGAVLELVDFRAEAAQVVLWGRWMPRR